ncbi:MAG: hypothetical protein WC792_04915 [Candidatus Micrarchaeia archaeon]|jgi:hypothetical protein
MDKNAFFLVRPYSLTGIVAIGLLAHLAANSKLAESFFFDVLLALSMWVAVNVFAEFIQNDTVARKKDASLLVFSIVIFSVIGLLRNPYVLLSLPVLLLVGWVYSLKTKKTPISRFSFLLRGLVEVLVFSVIFLSQSSWDNLLRYVPYVASIYLITCARNLVGDLRDMSVDKFTFPLIFGVDASKAITLGLVSFVVLLIGDLQVVFPLLVILLALVLKSDYYELHKFFVLSTLAFLVNLSAFLIGETLLLTNLVYAGALLMYSYGLVPRRVVRR